MSIQSQVRLVSQAGAVQHTLHTVFHVAFMTMGVCCTVPDPNG